MRKEKQKRAAKSIWIEPVHEVPLIFLRFPGNSFYTGKKKNFSLSFFLARNLVDKTLITFDSFRIHFSALFSNPEWSSNPAEFLEKRTL